MTTRSPLDGVVLTFEALNGLEFAAARRDGHALSSLAILVGLITADADGAWEGVQLQTSYLGEEDVARVDDPAPEPAGEWHGVPLTATATAGLETAVRIAAEYHLVPVPAGALAIGLLAQRDSAACRALLDGAAVTHAQLLDLVQDDVLDVTLEGLAESLQVAPAGRGARALGRLLGRGGPAAPDSVRGTGWVKQPAGALDLLADAVDHAGSDQELRELLESMLPDAAALRRMSHDLRALPDVDASEVLDRARRRFDTDLPDPAAVVVAAALSGSARLSEALRRLAIRPAELAAVVAEHRLRRAGGWGGGTPRVFSATLLNGLLTAVTSLLVIRAAVGEDGHWWKLLFLWIVWTGYPQTGPIGSAFVAAVLAIAVAPIAGASHLVAIVADVIQAYAERRTLLARTGVQVSLAEMRGVAMRLLNRRGRRVRALEQRRRAWLLRVREGRQDVTA